MGVVLALLAAVVQLTAVLGVAHLRGSFTAYAYQSPDSVEYVQLARGLATVGRYVSVNPQGEIISGPDFWRMPGYPAYLAGVMWIFGDSTAALLLSHQLLGIASVLLFWSVVRRLAGERWALWATIAWIVDPFRNYYSLWMMSETLFTVVLLLAGVLWTHGAGRMSTARALGLGMTAGLCVLVRPIALFLPMGLALAVFVRERWFPREQDPQAFKPRRRGPAMLAGLCLLGAGLVVSPWIIRNGLVGGHYQLNCEAGPAFAYHKVVDVILWSQGRSDERFNQAAVVSVRESIDEKLRAAWAARVGPLDDATRERLCCEKLNFGLDYGSDPFDAHRLFVRVGMGELFARPGSTASCFIVQGLKLFIFPLGLVLDPPAGEGAAPLSTLLGGGGILRRAIIPAMIGVVYAGLALLAFVRIFPTAYGVDFHAGIFAVMPVICLFVQTLPFEDPRFRLSMTPFLLMLVKRPHIVSSEAIH